jgi:hypothetical protein
MMIFRQKKKTGKLTYVDKNGEPKIQKKEYQTVRRLFSGLGVG